MNFNINSISCCFIESLKQMEIHLFSDGAPVQSTISLTEGHFKVAGQLTASSVLQGGPAPNFLAGWVYQYISGGLSTVSIRIEDIKNNAIKAAVEKVFTIKCPEICFSKKFKS